MSLLSHEVNITNGVQVKTFIQSELAQLIIAVLLVAVYLIEVIDRVGNDQFIAGALVAVIGYYFGGKNSVQSATTAANTTATAVNNATTAVKTG